MICTRRGALGAGGAMTGAVAAAAPLVLLLACAGSTGGGKEAQPAATLPTLSGRRSKCG